MWLGIALGVGASYVARRAGPVLAPLARPVAKATMKTALLGVERGRELAALAAEELEDIRAEVDAELKEERSKYWSARSETMSAGLNGGSQPNESASDE